MADQDRTTDDDPEVPALCLDHLARIVAVEWAEQSLPGWGWSNFSPRLQQRRIGKAAAWLKGLNQ